ncbi:MAG: S-layer homology domain-containing protein [Cellulosilyticaceae bacterium]
MKFKRINLLIYTLILGSTLLLSNSLYAASYSNEACNDPENVYVPEINKPEKPSLPILPILPINPCKPEQITHVPYIKGYEDGTFRAEQSVTREEFSTMVARLLLNGKEPEEETSFDDITSNRYSNKYVGYLENEGIIQGYSDGKFRPYEAITRVETGKIIEKVQQKLGQSMAETRAASFFNSEIHLTRAEAVTTLNGVFSRECSDAKISNIFSDLEESYWAYKDILFAAIPHNHKK